MPPRGDDMRGSSMSTCSSATLRVPCPILSNTLGGENWNGSIFSSVLVGEVTFRSVGGLLVLLPALLTFTVRSKSADFFAAMKLLFVSSRGGFGIRRSERFGRDVIQLPVASCFTRRGEDTGVAA